MPVKMVNYVAVVIFLFYAVQHASALCSNATICVASGNRTMTGCRTVHRLSELSVDQISCKSVNIYLTSGTHILDGNLTIANTVEQTAIHGASSGQPSIIECEENVGIRFSESRTVNNVFLSNIILVHCGTRRIVNDVLIQVALYFKYAMYALLKVGVVNTNGYGLYADRCSRQVISNCSFRNNAINMQFEGHLSSIFGSAFVNMSKTIISDAKGRGVSIFFSKSNCNFSIVSCQFLRNKAGHLIITTESLQAHVTNLVIKHSSFAITAYHYGVSVEGDEQNNLRVTIQNSNFSSSNQVGLLISKAVYVNITSCIFANNTDGIRIEYYDTSARCRIVNCSVLNNTGVGMIVQFYPSSTRIIFGIQWWVNISRVAFYNNSRALSLISSQLGDYHRTRISECNFTNHRILEDRDEQRAILNIENGHAVILENSIFRGNQGFRAECSAIYLKSRSLKLKDVQIMDNNCTGITIFNSLVTFINTVELTRNQGLKGGAISLDNSELKFTRSSELKMTNNTSHTYGGGIYTANGCHSDLSDCFFQLEVAYGSITDSKVITFSGNSANYGGDVVFGGCLSHCVLWINPKEVVANRSNQSNEFWKIVNSENITSLSTFVEYPKKVSFCANTSSPEESYPQDFTCSDSYRVSVYRGQIFRVPLVVVDDFCAPSIELIESSLGQCTERKLPLTLQHEVIQQSKKYCEEFFYTLSGGLDQKTAKIAFSIQRQFFLNMPPVVLMVHLNDCPAGFEIDLKSGQCGCQGILDSYKIQCQISTYSLKIPAQTWMGELKEGLLAVQSNCNHCNKKETLLANVTRSSDDLCVTGRHGVMCGACSSNYSLRLGGYECGNCSKSTYKGVLLSIAFAIAGIALVLVLLGLNLTVSTAMINGAIFYSNIVYLNGDTLLPITREGSNTHLQNAVRILSTFQAWMNLDFGITTCFFDGYDTYISTWMQFVFPLYIWLLILIIVLASRYSSKISKMTTSNTVSVLATLLLLSYAKLLKASIDAFSFTDMKLLLDSSRYRVWILDGNIPYLQGKHIPLFLMSLLVVFTYILPFTLLILLGPVLQAKSHYRVLHWINKLKPFLDAFYGPYTSRYRYWPGILLLARVTVLLLYAFYSLGDSPFKLMTVSMIAAVLLVVWMLIGKTQNTSLHQKTPLNYLELFFLLNLVIFTVASIYHSHVTKNIANQQGLALAMVGSVLVAFWGILVYQIFHLLKKFTATHKIIQCIIPAHIKSRCSAGDETPQPVSPQKTAEISNETTYSVMEMTKPADELREPLLTSS